MNKDNEFEAVEFTKTKGIDNGKNPIKTGYANKEEMVKGGSSLFKKIVQSIKKGLYEHNIDKENARVENITKAIEDVKTQQLDKEAKITPNEFEDLKKSSITALEKEQEKHQNKIEKYKTKLQMIGSKYKKFKNLGEAKEVLRTAPRLGEGTLREVIEYASKFSVDPSVNPIHNSDVTPLPRIDNITIDPDKKLENYLASQVSAMKNTESKDNLNQATTPVVPEQTVNSQPEVANNNVQVQAPQTNNDAQALTLDGVSNSIKERMAKFASQEQQISSLTTENATLKDEISKIHTAQKELEEMKKEKLEWEHQLSSTKESYNTTIKKLDSDIKRLENEINDKKTAYENAVKAKEEAIKERDMAKQEAGATKTVNTTLNENLKNVTAERDKFALDNDTLIKRVQIITDKEKASEDALAFVGNYLGTLLRNLGYNPNNVADIPQEYKQLLNNNQPIEQRTK